MDIAFYLKRFDAENPQPLSSSPRGSVWCVDTEKGPAVLKVLSERGLKAGELTGAKALQLWNGDGAVHLLGQYDQGMLFEFVPGYCLGEIVLAGHHIEAAQIVVELAEKLRKPLTDEIKAIGFMTIQNNFDAALTNTDFLTFPLQYQNIFKRAQSLWHWLIDSTQERYLLHGDLNLDNILESPRGWVAIDPKGLIGDPCYEFAVTFRTPFNRLGVTASRERIMALAEVYASQSRLDKLRILQFGFTHVALSLSYHLPRGNHPDADLALLETFDSLDLY